MRKLIILLIIVIALGGIWYGWQSWQSQSSNTTPVSSQNNDGFFPSGGSSAPSVVTNNTIDRTNNAPATGGLGQKVSAFHQITSNPVAGANVIGLSASSTPQLVYAERASGHVYSLDLTKQGPVRLSNTTIPQVYQFFAAASSTQPSFLFRYLKVATMQNYLATINSASSSAETINKATGDLFISSDGSSSTKATTIANVDSGLVGEFISANAYGVVISPKQDQIFYFDRFGGRTIGYTINLNTNKKIAVFDSPIGEWRAIWSASSTLHFQTKPTSNYPGYLYQLDLKTKRFSRILGGIDGLVANPSPLNDKILLSGNQGGQTFTALYRPNNRALTRLSIKTLAEKCVWSYDDINIYCAVPTNLPNAEYPDSWYRGEISFADNLWRVNTETGNATVLYSPELNNLGQTIDGTNLLLSPGEQNLFLINKKDATLWAFDLHQGF